MKALEITPLLHNPDGTSRMLPPVIWNVPNNWVGINVGEKMGRPWTLHDSSWQVAIPGSSLATEVRLSFIVRLLEHEPDVTPTMTETIDADLLAIFHQHTDLPGDTPAGNPGNTSPVRGNGKSAES